LSHIKIIIIQGVICWAGTSPKKLGYSSHINLEKNVCPTPQCHRPNSYLWDIGQDGKLWACPYGEPCTKYTSEEIINELTKYEEFESAPLIPEPVEVKESCGDNCHCNKQPELIGELNVG